MATDRTIHTPPGGLMPRKRPPPGGPAIPPIRVPKPVSPSLQNPWVTDSLPGKSPSEDAMPRPPGPGPRPGPERGRGPRPTPAAATPTVSESLGGLLESDSPYLARARTRGRQFANRRGLLNSSIAAGAAEAAAIDAALPIASADAGQLFEAEQRRADRDMAPFLQEREHRVQQLMQTERLDHDTAQRQADREMAQKVQLQVAREASNRFINDAYQRLVVQISQNTDLPVEERRALEEHLGFIRDQQMEAAGLIYEYVPEWSSTRRPREGAEA